MKTVKAIKLPKQTRVRPRGFPPVSRTLPIAVKRLISELNPEKIILFGSYAYGKPTPDSDVDLLIVMKTRAKYIDRYVAVSNLLIPREFPVDILVKTPKEIKQEEKKKSNFFLREILTKGKVLYARPQ